MAAGSRTTEQEKKWAYDSNVLDSCVTIKRHPKAYIPISDIMSKEHLHGKSPFKKEKALYLETVETELSKSERRRKKPIVDFSIGIKQGKQRMLRLVEAKFDVADLKNIEVKNVYDKVRHSSDLLQSSEITIESGAVVLISNNSVVQQQRHWFQTQLISKGHYSVKTVEAFYNDYFKV